MHECLSNLHHVRMMYDLILDIITVHGDIETVEVIKRKPLNSIRPAGFLFLFSFSSFTTE